MACEIVCENELIPFAADDMNIIFEEMYIALFFKYMIVGRCHNGARFYSEILPWSKAEIRYEEYKTIIEYFGGGAVDLYEIVYEECNLVKTEAV